MPGARRRRRRRLPSPRSPADRPPGPARHALGDSLAQATLASVHAGGPTRSLAARRYVAVVIDLHCHSSCSDGTDAPERLARLAADAGLGAVALTDHDTRRGLRASSRPAPPSACELSGLRGVLRFDQGRSVHVLCYFISDDEGSALRDTSPRCRAIGTVATTARRTPRRARLHRITLDEAVARDGTTGRSGRPHFAKAIQRLYPTECHEHPGRLRRTPRLERRGLRGQGQGHGRRGERGRTSRRGGHLARPPAHHAHARRARRRPHAPGDRAPGRPGARAARRRRAGRPRVLLLAPTTCSRPSCSSRSRADSGSRRPADRTSTARRSRTSASVRAPAASRCRTTCSTSSTRAAAGSGRWHAGVVGRSRPPHHAARRAARRTAPRR